MVGLLVEMFFSEQQLHHVKHSGYISGKVAEKMVLESKVLHLDSHIINYTAFD